MNRHFPAARLSISTVSNSPEEREPLRRHRTDQLAGTQWFYEALGQVIGPLTSAQLLAKVRSGEVAGNTPVRKDDSQWVNAEEVNGLFQAARRDKTTYKCPYCGAKIDKPPSTCLACDRDVTAAYRVREKPSAPAAPSQPAQAPTAVDGKLNGSGVRGFFSWFKSFLDDEQNH